MYASDIFQIPLLGLNRVFTFNIIVMLNKLFNFGNASIVTSDKDEVVAELPKQIEQPVQPKPELTLAEMLEKKKQEKAERQRVLIDQCHTEIDTAADRLIQDAKNIIAKHQIEFALEDNPSKAKADRLKALGFTQTPVQKAANEINGRNLKIKEKEASNAKAIADQEAHIELINYYQKTYPYLKFLTIPEFKKILEKYGLVMAPAYRFIDDVPEKNLIEIENAQALKAEDIAETFNYFEVFDAKGNSLAQKFIDSKEVMDIIFKWQSQYMAYDGFSGRRFNIVVGGHSVTLNEYSWNSIINELFDYKYADSVASFKYVERKNDGLFIAATKNELNLEGLKETDNGFVVETVNQGSIEVIARDPIVFRYVRGGVQVLTKWGPEANDPGLALAINN